MRGGNEMKNEIVQVGDGGVSFQTIADIQNFASLVAKSSFLPKMYANKKPEEREADVFTAIVFGAEIGLTPMSSIQNIAVVNGQPSIWGDIQLGVVEAKGKLEEIREYYEGAEFNDDYIAVCEVKRAGREWRRENFSVSDAKRAGLWGKSGTWTTHPKRMLKYKARSFLLRDVFPDILKGVRSQEEMEGEGLESPKRKMVQAEVVVSPNEELFEQFRNELNALSDAVYREECKEVMDRARLKLPNDSYQELKSEATARYNSLKPYTIESEGAE